MVLQHLQWDKNALNANTKHGRQAGTANKKTKRAAVGLVFLVRHYEDIDGGNSEATQLSANSGFGLGRKN